METGQLAVLGVAVRAQESVVAPGGVAASPGWVGTVAIGIGLVLALIALFRRKRVTLLPDERLQGKDAGNHPREGE